MRTEKERLEKLEHMALVLNADMPTDIYLKGDGSFWVTVHGNAGINPRKISNEEILGFVYTAMDSANRMTSV